MMIGLYIGHIITYTFGQGVTANSRNGDMATRKLNLSRFTALVLNA